MSSFLTGSSATAAEQQRRAKIVATLGPASNNELAFRQLVRAGLDVARLNFSHGTHAEKLKLIEMVREVARQEEKSICILGDLQGPKIRTGKLLDRLPVQLTAGQNLTITPRDVVGTATLIGTTFPTLAENLESGSRILLSDGLIELRVLQINGEDVECTVINGGILGETKGINLPGIPVRVPSLTEKRRGRPRVRHPQRRRRDRRIFRPHRRGRASCERPHHRPRSGHVGDRQA